MAIDYKPLSGREFPRFSAIKTFFRLPHVPVDADYDVGIVGLPFDGNVSYRPGARFAPTSVREYSSLGRGYNMNRAMQVFTRHKFADIGDCPTVPIDSAQTYQHIENYYGRLLQLNKKFLTIGGDHSTTLPILRTLRKHYGKPLHFIHFDAHLDTYPAAWGCEYHHGSFLRHALEENLLSNHILQIGIRGPLVDSQDLDVVKKHKVQVKTIDAIREVPLSQFCKSLPEFDDNPTYISFDIDCLDPVYAPGTGTPVVGGMTTYETQSILRALKIKNLVGADIVEISPPYDHAGITALAGVDTAFELMCLF